MLGLQRNRVGTMVCGNLVTMSARFQLILVLLAMFIALLPAAVHGQGIPLDVEGDDEDSTLTVPTVKRYDEAMVVADGQQVMIDAEIEVPVAKNLELYISRLKPNSFVTMEIRKTGVKLERVSLQANELGDIVLEVTTPKRKIGATVDVEYYASSGKLVTFRCRVVFR